MGQVDGRNAELLGEALRDVFFRDKAQLDEGLTKLSARLLLELEGVFELILADQARFCQ